MQNFPPRLRPAVDAALVTPSAGNFPEVILLTGSLRRILFPRRGRSVIISARWKLPRRLPSLWAEQRWRPRTYTDTDKQTDGRRHYRYIRTDKHDLGENRGWIHIETGGPKRWNKKWKAELAMEATLRGTNKHKQTEKKNHLIWSLFFYYINFFSIYIFFWFH